MRRDTFADGFHAMVKQAHVLYSGRVQGVGFRYTAQDFARELGLNGWVKNLRDGKVEVLAQGEETVLKEFLQKLNGYFGRYIQDAEVDWQSASGEVLPDFSITF